MQKNKKSDSFLHAEHACGGGSLYKRINRRLTQVQEMQNAPNIYCANA